jgi:hypothetical protein
MNEVDTAPFFISICYALWFLRSYLANNSPSNELLAIKSAFIFKDQFPKLGQAMLGF